MLNIGIFYKEEDSEKMKPFLDKFKEINLTGTVYKMGKNWEAIDANELRFQLVNLTYIIIFPFESGFNSRWFSFLIGFSVGLEMPTCIYEEQNIEIPNYTKAFSVLKTQGELFGFIESKVAFWEQREKIRQAKIYFENMGITPNLKSLFKAVEDNNIDQLKYFMAIGFSVDEISERNLSLLISGIRSDKREIVDKLLEMGADPDLKTPTGDITPLMEACSKNKELLAKRLLEMNADPNKKNINGQTPLMLTMGHGNPNLVRLLIKYGADLSLKDSLDMTAEDYARVFNHEGAIGALKEDRKENL